MTIDGTPLADSERYGTGLTSLGWCYIHVGKPALARDLFQRALDIRERLLPSGHPDISQARISLSLVCETLGEIERALIEARKAESELRSKLGANALPTCKAAQMIGRMLLCPGKTMQPPPSLFFDGLSQASKNRTALNQST